MEQVKTREARLIEEQTVNEIMSELKSFASTDSNMIESLFFGTAERTFFESPKHGDSMFAPYNRDDLYQKAGDHSIYEDMLNDDQVSVALRLKKDLVIGSGYEFVAEEDNQDDIVDDLNVAFREDPDRPFEDMLDEILTAYEFGFSISEKIFQHRPDGSLTLRNLKTRHPDTWLLYQSPQGEVIKYEQSSSGGDLDVNPRSIIHYINNPRFDNPYGTSDLRPAYEAWFVKRQIIRYLGIFLEKHASPVPVGRFDKNAPVAARDALLKVLKKLQQATALVAPKEVDLQFLESRSNGEAYHKAIALFNLFIGRSLFIPDLLGFTGSETGGGSFALGKEQMQVFFKHIKRRRRILEELINKHIVKPIVISNHGFIDNFPKFQLQPISDSEAIELATTWLEAVKGKVYKPSEQEINHFRSLTKFPEGEVEFEAPAPINPGFGEQSPEQEQSPQDGEPQVNPEAEAEAVDKENQDKKEMKKTYASRGAFDETDGDYSNKVDFDLIESTLNSADKVIQKAARRLIDEIFDDFFERIQKKRIIERKKPELISTMKLKKVGELKKLLKEEFRSVHKKGMEIAKNEIFQSNFATTPLPSDEFLAFLETELFEFIGEWQFAISKGARVALTAAIKNGEPLSSVIQFVNQSSKQEALVSLERFARTKFTEVMNRGRLEFFESAEIVDGYQYSAILDDRTTSICQGLHGKKFKKGTQPIPPLHFNCRSTLIPITKFEKFNPDKKVGARPIESFIKENKGKGF